MEEKNNTPRWGFKMSGNKFGTEPLTQAEKDSLKASLQGKLEQIFNETSYKIGDYTKITTLVNEITKKIKDTCTPILLKFAENNKAMSLDSVEEAFTNLHDSSMSISDRLKSIEDKTLTSKVLSIFQNKEENLKRKNQFVVEEINKLGLSTSSAENVLVEKISSMENIRKDNISQVNLIVKVVEEMSVYKSTFKELLDFFKNDIANRNEEEQSLEVQEMKRIVEVICHQIEALDISALTLHNTLTRAIAINDNSLKILADLNKNLYIDLPNYNMNVVQEVTIDKMKECLNIVDRMRNVQLKVIQKSTEGLKDIENQIKDIENQNNKNSSKK